MDWVIKNQLARSSRPGYGGEYERGAASVIDIEYWVARVKKAGIKSIICLLAEEHLVLYSSALPSGLIRYYEDSGFFVAHIPVRDHQYPPLTSEHLEQVWEAFQTLEKPVLVHCSAGVDRTGRAIEFIKAKFPYGKNFDH